ncbi:hypothetical protein [Shewanella algae]|uniref:hypothetical protein n=1 Tax=Shewanella algae TaxID=38313 RepID=UPI001AAE52DA|nr:hypothetical protein [Shewanella algae]MBO2698144.1 hypothetical protein [Shewanella algae]
MSELNRQHPIVLAAYAMVKAHSQFPMMNEAVEEVLELFPALSEEQARVMWIAINAKDKE